MNFLLSVNVPLILVVIVLILGVVLGFVIMALSSSKPHYDGELRIKTNDKDKTTYFFVFNDDLEKLSKQKYVTFKVKTTLVLEREDNK